MITRHGNYSGGSGKTGAGGLLIIYANYFSNNGSVQSVGSDGGSASAVNNVATNLAYATGGGGSGGGCIMVFSKSQQTGTYSVTGGSGGTASATGAAYKGGAGGAGRVVYTILP